MPAMPPDRRNALLLLDEARKKFLARIPGAQQDAYAWLYVEATRFKKYHPWFATQEQWLDQNLLMSQNIDDERNRAEQIVRSFQGDPTKQPGMALFQQPHVIPLQPGPATGPNRANGQSEASSMQPIVTLK